MMARYGSRAWKDEIVRTYYGINRTTMEVEGVYESRDGTLIKWDSDLVAHRTPRRPPNTARDEIVIVYGLTDIFETSPQLEDHESVKSKLADLKAKADEMKRARVLK